MDREYDIFEELPDGSLFWRGHAVGLRGATLLLKKISKTTNSALFAMCLRDKQVIGRANIQQRLNSKPLVFQIEYDERIGIERAGMLREHGYEPVSVFGDESAKAVLETPQQYELFLIGPSEPVEQRREMVEWLKQKFPQSSVLALNPPGVEIPEADYNVPQSLPERWLRLLATKRKFKETA